MNFTPREKRETRRGAALGCRVSPRVGWFSRTLGFHSLYYPWGKMGTTRSQSFWKFWKMFFLSLLEVAEIQTRLFGWMESVRYFFSFFFFLTYLIGVIRLPIRFLSLWMNTVYTELLKKLVWKSDNYLIFHKLYLIVSDRVRDFFFSSIHWFTHWKYVLDKIVACSLKTLMIKITVQFQKHNAMIATENFFSGGGGGSLG